MNAIRSMALLAFLAMVLIACGSPEPEPDSNPDAPFTISYNVSGGIAGMTFVDLTVNSDGSGTIVTFDSEPMPFQVTPREAADLLTELESYGVYDLDDPDPVEGLADGTGVGITIQSGNGEANLGAYGLGEAPDQFDDDLRSVAATLAEFAASVQN